MTTTFTMQPYSADSSDTFYITESAIDRLKYLKNENFVNNHQKEFYFKITVLSGGCAGFQYKFDFSNEKNTDDLLFSHDNINVVTDCKSFNLIKNTMLDYVEELIGAAFTLKNPNANSACGCGNSFSI